MTDISEIIGTKLMITPGETSSKVFYAGYENAEKIKTIAKEGQMVSVGYDEYPVHITKVNAVGSGSPGSTGERLKIELTGAIK